MRTFHKLSIGDKFSDRPKESKQYWKMIYGKTDRIRPTRQEKANAEYIVKCCNSHEALVEALKNAVDSLESFGCEDVDYYRDILKTAGETEV